MATPRRSAPCLHGVLWTVSVLDQRYHTRYHKSFLHEWKRTGGWSGLLLLVGWCWFVSWLVSRLKVPWILTSCKLLIGMGGRACDPIHHSMVSLQHLQHQRHLNSHGSFQWMAFQVVPFGKWVASFPFFPILSVVKWSALFLNIFEPGRASAADKVMGRWIRLPLHWCHASTKSPEPPWQQPWLT